MKSNLWTKAVIFLLGFIPLTVLFAITVNIPTQDPTLWTFDTSGPVRSMPAVVGDTLFVGSDSGFLYFLDTQTGKEKGRFEADSAISSNPLIVEGIIYFTSKKGTVYALDIKSGKAVWSFKTNAKTLYPGGWDYFISSPTEAGKYIIAGSGDNHIYALGAKTGQVAWSYDTGDMVRSTPLVDFKTQTVYCGTMKGEILALSLKKGKLKWSFKSKGNKYFPKGEFLFKPLLYNGVIYMGSRDASFYAVNAATGKMLWRVTDAAGAWYTHGIAADGTIFAASSDGHYIQALEPSTGKEKWKFRADDLIFTVPCVHEGRLYFGSHDNYIYILDAKTGEQIRRIKTADDILGSPLVLEDSLYIGSDDGKLYALDTKKMKTQPSSEDQFRAVYYAPELDKSVKHIHSNLPWQIYTLFRDRNYRQLDGDGLIEFMRQRLKQGEAQSTRIVLASFAYPYALLEANETKGSHSLLKQYLDKGGSLVWIGNLPQLVITIKEKGSKAEYRTKELMAALGIDKEFLNGGFFHYDAYISHPTEQGKQLGMPSWWSSGFGVNPEHVTTVFSINEHGKATTWIKSFGGPEGTGLIRLWSKDRLPEDISFIVKQKVW